MKPVKDDKMRESFYAPETTAVFWENQYFPFFLFNLFNNPNKM
jgi:hypothetical protein